jgi:hypothetical protein
VGNQADARRENLRLQDIGHGHLGKQISPLAEGFEDERLQLLGFGAAGARALDGILRKLDQTAVGGLLARFEKRHFRHGHEQVRQVRRERQDEPDLLAAAAGEQGAVAFIFEQAQVHADRVERQFERDVFGVEDAESFLGLRRAVLRGVLEQVRRGLRFLGLDQQPQDFEQLGLVFGRSLPGRLSSR